MTKKREMEEDEGTTAETYQSPYSAAPDLGLHCLQLIVKYTSSNFRRRMEGVLSKIVQDNILIL